MAVRFEFDLSFERAGERVDGGAAQPRCAQPHPAVAAPFEFPWLERSDEAIEADPTPPARTFSAGELDAAVAAARAETAAATEVSVRAEVEAHIAARHAAALEQIAAGLAAHQAAFEQALAARGAASRDLALALARALVPRALERQPLADIEAMLRELLIRLEGQPRLTLALPPDLVDAGQRTLAALAAEAGYRGELMVEPDRTLGAGDARLSWRGGSAERDLAELEREATALVDAWLPETAAQPWPADRADVSCNGAMA